MKKLPQRMCIGCGMQKDKEDLIRIVKNKQGEILLDKEGRLLGRGAYICNSSECLEKIIKTKRLEKNFEMKIEDTIYEELRKAIKE